MKKTFFYVCSLILACCFVACNESPQQTEDTISRPKHVVIVGFDGFSTHSLNNGAEMPTLRKLMSEGAYTLENRTILPSISAPNWATMFMGAGPELHGFTQNSDKATHLPRVVNEDDRFPNIFGLYREKYPEAEIGFIHEWGGLRYVVDTLAFNFRQQVPMNEENPEGCTPVAIQYIKEKKPDLCAVLFDQPDGTGHAQGWSSPEYMDMMNHLDKCLAKIIKATEEAGILDETVFVIVSDHGGINKGHGGKTMEEMQTPLTFYGKGIKKGHEIRESVVMYDIAGTLAYLLDVEQPQVWTARPVRSIFE